MGNKENNGFVTDVFYFWCNKRKNSFLTVINLIFAIFMITVLPIVCSLPYNEIDLPKDIGNERKTGLVKADNVASTWHHHNNKHFHNHTRAAADGVSFNRFEDETDTKHPHRRRGKHHKKYNHHKKHNVKSDHKELHDDSNTKDSTSHHKRYEQKANKFDYYPIEPVSIKDDPKDYKDIHFELITGDDEKPKEENNANQKIKSRRHKRDTTDQVHPAEIVKRSYPSNTALEREYVSQFTRNDPWNNPYNGFGLPKLSRYAKIPVPGLYYNAITPHKFLGPVGADAGPNGIGNRFDTDLDEVGPIWERRPISNALPSATVKPETRPAQARPQPATTRAPMRTQTTTRAPGRPQIGIQPTPEPTNSGPSSCVWAIVNCCSKSNTKIRYECFEQIGCHGAFWDFNPCGDDWQRRAIDEAEKYFDDYE